MRSNSQARIWTAGPSDVVSSETHISSLGVVLPVYNTARFLSSALDSVLEQALAAFEHLQSNLRYSRSGVRFLLRVDRASLQRHLYSTAIVCVGRLLSTAPLTAASIVWQKLVRAYGRPFTAARFVSLLALERQRLVRAWVVK